MRRRPPARATRARVALLAALTAGVVLGSSAVGATGLLPPANPPTNVRPVPDFLSSGSCASSPAGLACANPCVGVATTDGTKRLAFPTYDDSPRCVTFLLRAINSARQTEGLGHLQLPTNWYALSVPEQLFVVADLERVDRGLPPYLGLNRALHAAAQDASEAQEDPPLAPGFPVDHRHRSVAFGSTWSSGFSALEADYIWMYDDGWGAGGSMNEACTSPTSPGCWAHRDELLGFDPGFNSGVGLHCATCEMGTGYAVVAGYSGFTDLIERPAGRPPAMYFTWARNVEPYLTPASTGPLPTTTTPPTTSPTTTTTILSVTINAAG